MKQRSAGTKQLKRGRYMAETGHSHLTLKTMQTLSGMSFIELQAMLKYALEQKDIADAAGHSGVGINWNAKIDSIKQAIAAKFDAI